MLSALLAERPKGAWRSPIITRLAIDDRNKFSIPAGSWQQRHDYYLVPTLLGFHYKFKWDRDGSV